MKKFVIVQTYVKIFELDAFDESDALQRAEEHPQFRRSATGKEMSNWHAHEVIKVPK